MIGTRLGVVDTFLFLGIANLEIGTLDSEIEEFSYLVPNLASWRNVFAQTEYITEYTKINALQKCQDKFNVFLGYSEM